MKLHNFCSAVWPNKQIWNRDIDKSVDTAMLDVLSSKTGVPNARIIETTLAAYEGILYEHHNPYGNTPWIMPLGIYHRTHKQFGLQFCPRCLADDEIVYYRRRWRLAFITCCVLHSVQLLDRCHKCAAPVNFHRDEMGQRGKYTSQSMVLCHLCKADIREASIGFAKSSDPQVENFQNVLTDAMTANWIEVPGCGAVYCHLFFSVVHQLMKVLLQSRHARSLRAATGTETDALSLKDISRVRSLERVQISERAVLLKMTRRLLEDWPHRLVDICSETETWSSILLRDFEPAPFWFWSVVHDYLFRTSYSPSDQEIRSIIAYLEKTNQPVSRKAISKYLGVTDAFRKRKTEVLSEVKAAERSSRLNDDG